ncbi:uncharacterized protein [Haliotis cracherodii]|uniref:uncharacterized protein n=1 Tax=Haliotis cracherodii TaxID=6455 RepID=UPI0039E80BF5
MSAATLLSVFAFLLITCVPQTEAQAGQVCVVQMTDNVDEDKGPVIFQFVRKQGSTGTISFSYNLADVTTEPEDIIGPRTGTIVLADGVTAANLSVEINDDTEEEDSEQFSITLTGGTGPESIATAIIFDNDVYSSWGEWVGDCSGTVTCGPANKTETRNRTCIAVVPPFCVQSLTENRTVDCNLPDCPTSGKILGKTHDWLEAYSCELIPITEKTGAALIECYLHKKTLRAVRNKTTKTAITSANDYLLHVGKGIQLLTDNVYHSIKKDIIPTQNKTLPLKSATGKTIRDRDKNRADGEMVCVFGSYSWTFLFARQEKKFNAFHKSNLRHVLVISLNFSIDFAGSATFVMENEIMKELLYCKLTSSKRTPSNTSASRTRC